MNVAVALQATTGRAAVVHISSQGRGFESRLHHPVRDVTALLFYTVAFLFNNNTIP